MTFLVLVISTNDLMFRRHICNLLLMVSGARLRLKRTGELLSMQELLVESLVQEIREVIVHARASCRIPGTGSKSPSLY